MKPQCGHGHRSSSPAPRTVAVDLDHDGTVDYVDAVAVEIEVVDEAGTEG
jgi:hypothetical protein